jgi:hypothetical protein
MHSKSRSFEVPPVDEAVAAARKIIAIPPGRIIEAIRKMTLDRNLSRTVRGLNALVLDHPKHRPIATRALENMGFWP